MIQPNEKAAGVLDTPEAASETQRIRSLSAFAENPNINPTQKEFACAQAGFALWGHTLSRIHRVPDRRVIYVVRYLGQGRYFSHWHDVLAHQAAIWGFR